MNAIVSGACIKQLFIVMTMISILFLEQDGQASSPSLALAFISLRFLCPFFFQHLEPARLLNSCYLFLDLIYFILLCNFVLKVGDDVLAFVRIDPISSNISLIFFNNAHA